MKMKKLFAGLAAAALFVSVGATTAFASDGWTGRYYQDADGDGICDHRASACRCLDEDGDGVCDLCGLTGWGAGCVDADGDGVCDYRGLGLCRSGSACGNYGSGCHGGYGYGYGHGHGRGCR